MKATELRIGNLVIVDNEKYHPNLKDIPLTVTSIDSNMDTENKNTHSIRLSHIKELKNQYQPTYAQFIKFIKPIPLTEEWLLKFGLLKVDGNYLLGSYELIFDKLNDRYNVWVLRGIICKLKYVHQLQNLYFALTGEELTIK